MRPVQLSICVIALVLLIQNVDAEHKRKHKKWQSRHHKQPPPPPIDELNEQKFHSIPEELEESVPLQHLPHAVSIPHSDVQSNNVPVTDLCFHKRCGAGRVCRLNEEGDAECLCIPSCPLEQDPRRKVCTNHNETWGSDCEVYQMQCYCDEDMDKCIKNDYKHIQIDYYGQCRNMPDCKEDEMADFPRRMRDWLFNIMRDLADRQDLSPYYMKLEREAETNLTRRWSNAAVWKWCDLDSRGDHDRSVSRHELFPIRAPLMSLEHCIAPFLDSCDTDNDHRITLTEWVRCLALEEDDFEDLCEDVRGNVDEE